MFLDIISAPLILQQPKRWGGQVPFHFYRCRNWAWKDHIEWIFQLQNQDSSLCLLFLPGGCLLSLLCRVLGAPRRPYLHGRIPYPSCSSSQLIGAEPPQRKEQVWRTADVFPGGHFFFSWTSLEWTPWGQARGYLLFPLSQHIEDTQKGCAWWMNVDGFQGGTLSSGQIQWSIYEPVQRWVLDPLWAYLLIPYTESRPLGLSFLKCT